MSSLTPREIYEQKVSQSYVNAGIPRMDTAYEADEIKSGQIWAPNRLRSILLPCGCTDIPWPLVHRFGDDFDRFQCDSHGEVRIPKNWKAKAKKLANQYARETSNQPLLTDEPPF